MRYFQRRVKRCQYKHCNAQTPPLNVQYVELLCYKVCMFANLKSVRLDVCLTIFMFVSKTFVNNEFANTKRCSRTSRTHCSRTISVREPCLIMMTSLEALVLTEGAGFDIDLGIVAFFEGRVVLSEALRFA